MFSSRSLEDRNGYGHLPANPILVALRSKVNGRPDAHLRRTVVLDFMDDMSGYWPNSPLEVQHAHRILTLLASLTYL